jgi:Secretion system C-terminal sorting domain/Beta-propeller repeat
MKRYIFFLLLVTSCFSQTTLQKTWSTYYFGNATSVIDSKVDNSGNIIVVGFVQLHEQASYFTQFTTIGCYQSTFNGGFYDGFIAKFTPDGGLLWATYFGGEADDVCRNIAIDENNNIYVTGFTQSYTHIATAGAYIENFVNIPPETGFIAKFTSTGNLLWSTYVSATISKIIYKNSNEIYIAGYTNYYENISTPGAYKEVMDLYVDGGLTNMNGYMMKFNSLGNRLYGTYLEKGSITDFEIDNDNNFIFSGRVDLLQSQSLGTTTSSHQQVFGGGSLDSYILKINFALNQKLWCTLYGGSDFDSCNNIELLNNDIYICGSTKSPNNIATAGSFQPVISNNTTSTYGDGFIAKFNTNGVQQWGTYYGGENGDVLVEIKFYNNKLYIAGKTSSATMATPGSYQDTYSITQYGTIEETTSGLFAEFNLDGTRNWASYYNGARIRNIIFSDFDGFYISGQSTIETGIATPGALQPTLNVGITTGQVPYNMFLSKFEFVPLSTSNFSDSNFTVSPNPVNDILNIMVKNNVLITSTSIYNTLGQLVLVNLNSNSTIDVSSLTKGNYFIKIISNDVTNTGKFIKE